MYTDVCVRSTQLNMRSMEQLGGSGGMPPRKFLKNKCSEIDSGEFCDQKLPLL